MHPESASGNSASWQKFSFKPWGRACDLHVMVTAVVGMVASVPLLWFSFVRWVATEVRAVGHIPRCSVEGPLYHRFYIARIHGKLSESQLAELAELPCCSVEPVRKRRRVLNDECDAGAAQPGVHLCPGSAARIVGVLRRPASPAR